jgi:hypothetical protein
MKHAFAGICSAAVVALLPIAANAASSTPYGMGGNVLQFDQAAEQANRSGELFRIEGHCQSACTIFLRLRNVCIDRNAELLFHAAKGGSAKTAVMLNAYRPALRNYLMANHYMDTQEFHTISGAEMISRFGYRQCPPK